ncbi:protein of unknown function [Cohaesibacter marisflavi]|uniref:Uncharacterized protein n=1 Tax=Cohaesibacter marisflavi TaxID=655353 RepID=A0A1I5JYG3_9HYPH|nr:DUF4747 family protein [Cohaesibacter marisflavi]SFO77818.1 protein of unknown function [Cohaesibacter marisflavi]
MVATNRVIFGALNIVAHPHPKGIYPKLLEVASKYTVNFRGVEFATISKPRIVEDGIYVGVIYVWTEVNKDEPAIDKLKLEEIDFDDSGVKIPDNIGLNLKTFYYALREKDHLLVVETKNELKKTFSVKTAHKFFENIFTRSMETLDIKEVYATIIPAEGTLKSIFNMYSLYKVVIDLKRPNPDDHNAAQRRVLRNLESQNAARQTIALVAASRQEGLDLNEDNKLIASVAEYSGNVVGEGRGIEGEKLKISTNKIPKLVEEVLEDEIGVRARIVNVCKRWLL